MTLELKGGRRDCYPWILVLETLLISLTGRQLCLLVLLDALLIPTPCPCGFAFSSYLYSKVELIPVYLESQVRRWLLSCSAHEAKDYVGALRRQKGLIL